MRSLGKAINLAGIVGFFLLTLVSQRSRAQLAFEGVRQIEFRKTLEASISDIRFLSNGEYLIGYSHAAALYNPNWQRIWPIGGLNSTALFFPLSIASDNTFYGTGHTTNHCVVHVMADGSVDQGFNSPSIDQQDLGLILTIQLQSDGKVVVGCAQPFNRTSSFNGINLGMFRLKPDGSLDETFQYQANGGIFSILILNDGKILANNINTLFRLFPNGQIDNSFISPPVGSAYTGMAVEPDGKIVVIGQFSRINGLARPGLARLEADGTLDLSFNPSVGPQDPIEVKIQPSDSRIIVISSKQIKRWLPTGLIDDQLTLPRAIGTVNDMFLTSSERIIFNTSIPQEVKAI